MSISLRDFSLGDPRIKQSLRKIGSKTPTVGADRGDPPVISCHQALSFSNSHALMAGEWNEENWFDLADYADVDMDADFDYEPSVDSSDGIAASGDLSADPGDHATDGVEEGSLSPTTIRPVEESTSSKDKGQSDHKQDCTQADSQHDESFSSKCSSPLKAVRLGEASSGSHNSGASPASGGPLPPANSAEEGIKHAFSTNSTIPSQVTPADGDGYNPEFPFLEGFTPSRQMVSLDYSSSGESSSACGDHQREVFVLPSDKNHSPGDRAEDAPRRSHTAPTRGNGKGTAGDEQNQHSDEREGDPRHTRAPLRQSQESDEEDLETTRWKRVAAQRSLPGRAQYQSKEAQELQHINDLLENPTRELARAPGYDLFAEEIAQRLRSTMARLESPRRHQSGSRSNTTSSATSRLNNSPRRDRRNDKSHRSPTRRRDFQTTDDQRAPRRGDR